VQQVIQNRDHEQIEAAKFIGAETLWIDKFDYTRLSSTIELIRRIESIMRYCHADVIYTHAMGDTHHDHRAVGEATLEAGRFVPNILSYEMPVTRDFKPHVYCDISDVIDDKMELLSLFSSQQHKMFICSNATKGLAQYRALQSRLHPLVTSVEAFEVLKLGLEADFQLQTAHTDATRTALENGTSIHEIVEWRPENPVLKRQKRLLIYLLNFEGKVDLLSWM